MHNFVQLYRKNQYLAEDEGFDLIDVRPGRAVAGGAEYAPHLDGFESLTNPMSKRKATPNGVAFFLA